MSTNNPQAMLYHLTKTIEAQTEALAAVQDALNTIKIDIAVMKQAGAMPGNRTRVKDVATGSGIAGGLVTVLYALLEFFNKGPN